MSETVLLNYEIKSPIERVWHALTDPATLSQWMFFETDDFQPLVGFRFQFRGRADSGWNGVVDCEVLEVLAPYRLSYSWATEGPRGRHQTTVLWILEESGSGVTHLQMEQSGFDSAAKQEIGGARYGWAHQLKQLQELLGPVGPLSGT